MKNELATRAVAIAWLARNGFQPAGDLVLIAEADEEDGEAQVGMPWLVRERPEVRTDYALNEGAAERLELADGRTVVTINVGEKGALRATVTAVGEAGPTSLPWSGENAVPLLARLIDRLSQHSPRPRLLPETDAMLTALVGAKGESDRADRSAPMPAPDAARPDRPAVRHHRRAHPAARLNRAQCDAGGGVRGLRLPADPRRRRRRCAGRAGRARWATTSPTGSSSRGRPRVARSPRSTPRCMTVCREWVARNDPDAVFIPTLCNGFTNSHYLRAAYGTVAYGIWPVRHTPTAVLHAGVHGRDERVHTADLGYATRFHIEACIEFSRRTGE